MNNKEDLVSTFNKLRNALCDNDVKALDEVIADDYKGYSLNGTIETKDDILMNFKPNGVVITKYLVEDTNFELHDNIGIVCGKGLIAGKFQEFNFEHHVLFTDIFKIVGSSWKYYKSQVTEIKST